jgi:hypothetical protein
MANHPDSTKYRCTRCGTIWRDDEKPPTCANGPCPMEPVTPSRSERERRAYTRGNWHGFFEGIIAVFLLLWVMAYFWGH